jgi:uncharacterized membrane protein YgcG
MSLEPDKPFHDDDAATVDKAIASSVIADYVSGKLQTLAGHFEFLKPNEFASRYQKWGESDRPVQDVPGFTDRSDKKKPIKLMDAGTLDGFLGKQTQMKGVTFEAVVHETIHLNSNVLFKQLFGFYYNEAVTEHFTLKVFGVSKGQGHQDKLFLADGLISAASSIPYGDRDVATAYFKDPRPLYERILTAFRGRPGYSANQWKLKSSSDKADDWKVADDLLKAAMANSAGRGSGAGSGSGVGSGSGAGSGSGGGSGSASAGSGSRR